VNQQLAQETYAVVVGIEQYQMGSNLSRDGIAKNALDFTDWLLTCGVPPDHISLFISELEKDEQKEGNEKVITEYKQEKKIEIKKATKNNITKTIFDEISQKQGKLLYFYWLGHGYITNVTQRQLLYADTTENTSPFNLSSFIESLKTDTFPNFDEQILFVDACAIYVSSTSMEQFYGEQLAREEYPIGQPEKRQQFSFLASQEGDTAKFDEEEKTGIFSKILLKIISQKSGLLIPEEMKQLVEEIKVIFQQDYPDYSEPIYLWCDAIGNVENFYLKSTLKNLPSNSNNSSISSSRKSRIKTYQGQIEQIESQIANLEELQNLCKRDFNAEQTAVRRHQLNIQIDNFSREIDKLYDKIEEKEQKINEILNPSFYK
jgi:hypothetical protein